MSSKEPCNCDTSLRLALELATERDKLTRIAELIRTIPTAAPNVDVGAYAMACVEQIGEILAEAPGERP